MLRLHAQSEAIRLLERGERLRHVLGHQLEHDDVVIGGGLADPGLVHGPFLSRPRRTTQIDSPRSLARPASAQWFPQQFHLTLTDQARHGADYLRIYVSKAGFDRTTEALGWDDLDLVKETGSYSSQGTYETDVDLSGHSGRAVLYTIWQASHLDQPYYLCSDINIGGAAGEGGSAVETVATTAATAGRLSLFAA
ncbi:lytic polysaccharide monooxygenase [Streptomyces griseoincarnatus]